MMQDRSIKLCRTAAQKLDLPTDRAAGLAVTELIGSGRLSIENHRGIIEYGQEKVAVLALGMTISVCGRGLELAAMNDRSLLLTGEIETVMFEK